MDEPKFVTPDCCANCWHIHGLPLEDRYADWCLTKLCTCSKFVSARATIGALKVERAQMRWLVAAVVRGAVGAGPRGRKWEDGSCPHGTTPYYPTHAWWCDECWTALYDAILYNKILVTGGKLMVSL